MAELDDPDLSERLSRSGNPKPLSIDRSAASLKVREEDGKVFADLNIPYEGDAQMLRMQPQTYTMNPPRGTFTERRWLNENATPNISATHEVARAASSDDVKESATRFAAAVEQYLQWQGEQLTAHKTAVKEHVDRGIELRRQQLRSLNELNDGLGGGI